MPENHPIPEGQVMLSNAGNRVKELYLKDSALLDTGRIEERDNSWKVTAEKFSVFSDKITELSKALKNADIKKKKYSDIAIAKYPRLFFQNVADEQAIEFLSDVWCSRIAVPDNPNYLMDTGRTEAQTMINEMREKKENKVDFCSIQPKTNLAEVMSSVLQGKLKLTPQPKQRT